MTLPSRNNWRTAASDSPTNLLKISLGPTGIRAACASPAKARASCVFPHPGGPCRRIDAGADRTPTQIKHKYIVFVN